MKRNVRGFLVVVCLLTVCGAANAATIVADATTCTLDKAIRVANGETIPGCAAGSPGADVIKLQYTVTLHGVLNSPLSAYQNGGQAALPDITSHVTIESDPAGKTIQRNTALGCGSGEVVVFRLFTVRGPNASLHLKDLTLKNGCVHPSVATDAAYGGAIDSDAPVTVTNCKFEQNRVRAATADAGGGAIRMNGAIAACRPSMAQVRWELGLCHLLGEDFNAARVTLEESQAAFRRLGEQNLGFLETLLAVTLSLSGRIDEAWSARIRSFGILTADGHGDRLASSLGGAVYSEAWPAGSRPPGRFCARANRRRAARTTIRCWPTCSCARACWRRTRTRTAARRSATRARWPHGSATRCCAMPGWRERRSARARRCCATIPRARGRC